MIRRICEQLDVRRGNRAHGRQFASDQAVNHCAQFETDLQLQKLPLKEGDIVWVAKALPLAKPGVWSCVQARVQWSTEEHAFMRPGHHWLCAFGDAGNGTSCVKQFNLEHRKWEDYRGAPF
jgi:hypothetical protein